MANSKVTYEMVSVDLLELDVKNPRIAQWIEMYGESVDENGMKLALMRGGPDDAAAGTSYSGLKQSIRTNGGVVHPIIVNRESNGKLLVIEGNTRLILYREFKKDGRHGGNWDMIPALVYDNMSEEEKDAIRLQSHLVGAREWDPYSKAKYLDALRNKLGLPFSQVVDFSGGNQREVEKLVGAYTDMEEFYRPLVDDQSFDYTRFGGFVELQNPRVIEALVISGFTKTDFAKWIKERKLHPLNTVRQLPRILQTEKSKQVFLAGGAEQALKLLDTLERPSSVKVDSPWYPFSEPVIHAVLGHLTRANGYYA